ncbi:MAG: type II toxin-antitoxin system PemK/MazF family toxin, partial [Agrococcus sp.]
MLLPRASWRARWTPFVRGDIYRLKAPRDARGHEQTGSRFAVVVQSDDLHLSTWLVAPTSTGRREASFR